MNKKIYIVLVVFALLSLFLNLTKKSQVPACINADEASFGYNSYSILNTGRDEYGSLLPLRLKSFGDYKMPLYSYLSVPFIKIFGLNDLSTRYLNALLSFFYPVAVFFIIKELFELEIIAAIGAALTAFSLGLHIVGRQAHEAYLATFLMMLATLFFIKIVNKKAKSPNIGLFLFTILLSLVSYQSSRVLALFFLVATFIYFRFKKGFRFFTVLFISTILVFLMTDLFYKPQRIKTLLFFNNPGFNLKVGELRAEGANKYFYNKITLGVLDIANEQLKYFSPQFLTIRGDENPRFGFANLSPITIVEYIFIFVGFYYLFKNKYKWRIFLLALFLFTPLSASLTWAGVSLTRSLYLFIIIPIIVSYGVYFSFIKVPAKYRALYSTFLFLAYLILLLNSWNFYFNHYPKRGLVIRSWQCGYKQLTLYIKNNYDRFDNFYISKEHGEPYIFLLYYLNYPPSVYQKEANLSPLDKYGFGQVEKFNKFIFTLTGSANKKNVSLVAYPHDFEKPKDYLKSNPVFKKIIIGREEIFWIYENP